MKDAPERRKRKAESRKAQVRVQGIFRTWSDIEGKWEKEEAKKVNRSGQGL